MRPDRAVVFDLDDTLYPYRRFKVSGFVAVAAHLHLVTGLDARLAFAALTGASRGPDSGREIQQCLTQHDLPASLLPDLVDVFRHHVPRLHRSAAVTRVLHTMRQDGWRLGILTNGQPSIQARKLAALGLEPLVDAIVFASTCGAGGGKPDPDTFATVARRLGVAAAQSVFVGNDERCDVQGASAAGFSTIRCDAWVTDPAPSSADAVLTKFAELPAMAGVVFEEASKRHAA